MPRINALASFASVIYELRFTSSLSLNKDSTLWLDGASIVKTFILPSLRWKATAHPPLKSWPTGVFWRVVCHVVHGSHPPKGGLDTGVDGVVTSIKCTNPTVRSLFRVIFEQVNYRSRMSEKNIVPLLFWQGFSFKTIKGHQICSSSLKNYYILISSLQEFQNGVPHFCGLKLRK
jgi:hypothetical protein